LECRPELAVHPFGGLAATEGIGSFLSFFSRAVSSPNPTQVPVQNHLFLCFSPLFFLFSSTSLHPFLCLVERNGRRGGRAEALTVTAPEQQPATPPGNLNGFSVGAPAFFREKAARDNQFLECTVYITVPNSGLIVDGGRKKEPNQREKRLVSRPRLTLGATFSRLGWVMEWPDVLIGN
jgi:hypothetical protein